MRDAPMQHFGSHNIILFGFPFTEEINNIVIIILKSLFKIV